MLISHLNLANARFSKCNGQKTCQKSTIIYTNDTNEKKVKFEPKQSPLFYGP